MFPPDIKPEEAAAEFIFAVTGRQPQGDEVEDLIKKAERATPSWAMWQFMQKKFVKSWLWRRADLWTSFPTDIPRVWYHWHIPKTAGTSLRQALEAILGAEHTLEFSYLQQFAQVGVGRLAQARLLTGHLGDAPLRVVPAERLRTVTVLRDPVTRYESYYRYQRMRVQTGRMPDFAESAAHVPFGQWVEWQMDMFGANEQARWLATPISLSEQAPEPLLAETRLVREGPSRGDITWGGSHEELRSLAFERLRGIDVVGTTDSVQSVVDQVACLEGVAAPTIERLNTTDGDRAGDVVPQDVADMVLERNAIDWDLCAAAGTRSKDHLGRCPRCGEASSA